MSRLNEAPWVGRASRNGLEGGDRGRLLAVASGVALATLLLASCAGGVTNYEVGRGFDYSATQAEVDAALAEHEPVVLTLQAGASSPNAHWAKAPSRLAEAVRERSGGKITIDVVYGQPIAPLTEVDEALADGRLDLALAVPAYDQATYPAYHDLISVTSGQPSSPIIGEAAHLAQSLDLAWNSEAITSELEAQQMVTLLPSLNMGSFFLACSRPADELGDWKGRMARASGKYVESAVRALGAHPVTMDLTEVYEGLQRNAVDCTVSQPLTSVDEGIMEAAPHLSVPTGGASLAARPGGALMGGLSFGKLPLAYQQVIFDATKDYLEGSLEMVVESEYEAVAAVKERGGSVTLLDAETNSLLTETNTAYRSRLLGSSVLEQGFGDRMAEAATYWQGRMGDLGYVEEGSREELDQWFEPGSVDFGPAAEAMFEKIVLPHRPG
jgi:TRAP-type C4-dicarboxylate transport system substrate-binding protein